MDHRERQGPFWTWQKVAITLTVVAWLLIGAAIAISTEKPEDVPEHLLWYAGASAALTAFGVFLAHV